jgi:UDP-N-acetylmuramoyl-tripeptide--D-alanyl-D-alanine ligase
MELDNLYQKFLASTGVTIDTRSIKSGNIFFALKGANFNANLFAEAALNQGADYVVVDEANSDLLSKYPDQVILIDNSLTALQQLAGYHRDHLQCPVLAITGSNGKTTTKELVAAVLSKKFKTYATKANLNNHIGIPLTLLSIKNDAEFAIVEMGANHVGEIASYCKYTNPNYGLITNVGLAHTEGFGGFQGVVRGKTELYQYLSAHYGKIFISQDNELLLKKTSDFRFDKAQLITYGKSPSAFCSGAIASNAELLSVIVDDLLIQTNLIGDYNFENAMSAICIGKYFGLELPLIKEAIEGYLPSNNRSQKISYGTNTIILDAYNANPSSMAEALRNFERIDSPNKVAILGEMMELGECSETEHQKIASQTKAMKLATKVFVGSGFKFFKDDSSVLWFDNTDDLKAWFNTQSSITLISLSRVRARMLWKEF